MDQIIQHWINREMTSPLMDQVMAIITSFTFWRPLLLIALVSVLFLGRFRARMMLLTLFITIGITDGLVVRSVKHLVGRPRPFQVEAGTRVLQLTSTSVPLKALFLPLNISYPSTPPPNTKVRGVSFPSSHSANIFLLATVLFLFYRRLGLLFYLVALLVAYSRIYTGMHWPLDVLVGSFVGIADGVLVTFMMNQLWRKWGNRIAPRLAERYPLLTTIPFINIY